MSKTLRLVGFCGVDDTVSPQLLKDLSSHYEWVEWGVLFRSDLEGQARYASSDWVMRLVEIQKGCNGALNLAAHLCGNRCQEVLEGDYSFVQSLSAMGFRRVQVNATAANSVTVDATKMLNYVDNIRKCVDAVPQIEWIIQCNDETVPIWSELVKQPPSASNMSLLYDASCGKGVLVTSFPSPTLYPSIRCGYAGGIGPSSISSVLGNLAAVVAESGADTQPVWVDMESSLRAVLVADPVTGATKDVFSVEKVFSCIERAVEAGMPRKQ